MIDKVSQERVLDIVIPAYNEFENLCLLLPILKRGLAKDSINVIVVDSSRSNDGTPQLCIEHQVHYLQSSYTQRSQQLNAGARLGTNEVIMFLHADVIPPEDFYEQIFETVDAGIQAGFFSYQFRDKRIMLKLNAYFTRFDGFFAGGGDQCHFFTRDCFNKLGGYDNDALIMEDYELFDRVRALAIPYQLIRSDAQVSSRKYENNSYLKVNLVNLITFVKYRLGSDPRSLKESYEYWL